MEDAEFIVAEDGSTDGTKEILEKLSNKLNIKVFSGNRRKGYVKAVKDALALANNELVFFSDSSGQHNPQDFWKLTDKIENFDLVIGVKSPRKDPAYRIYMSRGYNLIIDVLFGLRLHDIDCGFRLIRKQALDSVLPETKTLKHCVSSEITIRMKNRGFRIAEVPISHRPRPVGDKKNFSYKNLVKVVFELLLGIIMLRLELTRARQSPA